MDAAKTAMGGWICSQCEEGIAQRPGALCVFCTDFEADDAREIVCESACEVAAAREAADLAWYHESFGTGLYRKDRRVVPPKVREFEGRLREAGFTEPYHILKAIADIPPLRWDAEVPQALKSIIDAHAHGTPINFPQRTPDGTALDSIFDMFLYVGNPVLSGMRVSANDLFMCKLVSKIISLGSLSNANPGFSRDARLRTRLIDRVFDERSIAANTQLLTSSMLDAVLGRPQQERKYSVSTCLLGIPEDGPFGDPRPSAILAACTPARGGAARGCCLGRVARGRCDSLCARAKKCRAVAYSMKSSPIGLIPLDVVKLVAALVT